jgi:hypothetical protein
MCFFNDFYDNFRSSRQAILKYIMANFNVGKDAKSVNAFFTAGFFAFGFFVFGLAAFFSPTAFFAAGFLAFFGLAAFGLAAFFAFAGFLAAFTSPILKDPDAPVPFDCFKLLFLPNFFKKNLDCYCINSQIKFNSMNMYQVFIQFFLVEFRRGALKTGKRILDISTPLFVTKMFEPR